MMIVEMQKCGSDQLIERIFFEHVDLKNVQQKMWQRWEIQPFPGNDDDEVNAHRNPNLRFDGVDGVAEKVFDRQVLFDPLEKAFDRPPLAINLRNGKRRQIETIGQEDKQPDRANPRAG